MRVLVILSTVLLLSGCGPAPVSHLQVCNVSSALIPAGLSPSCSAISNQVMDAYIQDHGSKDCISTFEGVVSVIIITTTPNPYAYSQGVWAGLKSSYCAAGCLASDLAIEAPGMTPTQLAIEQQRICTDPFPR